MEHRGEHESDAGVAKASLDPVRPEVDPDAEGLEEVRRPAPRRRGAVPVLRDNDSRSRAHDRADRGDVERAGPITTRAARVDDAFGRTDRLRELECRP